MKQKMKTFIGISLTIIMFVSTLLTTSFTSEAASTGWINTSKGWTYQFSNGKKAKAEWVNGYWLNSAGYWTYKYRSSWKKNSRGWWYGDTTGWYAKYQWEKIDQNWYFFDKTGYMATGWEKIGKVWYYFNLSNGKMITGWKQIDGKWYFFNENGAMTIGWKKISGKWYYFYSNGQMMANRWALIDHKKYYFEKSGVWHEDHHNWVEVSKTSATCGQNGKLEQKCSICGITKVTTYPATGNHKYDNGVITKEATTTSTGIKTITCTVCGDSYQETIPKIEEEDPYIPDTPVHTHTLETVAAQAPTCTEPGWTEYKKCKTCDHKEGYTEIPATGHSFTDNIHYYSDEDCTTEITKESLTCNMNYWYKTKCDNCDTWTEVIYHKAGTHTPEKLDTSEESTCKVAGHDDYKCSVCGYTWSEDLPLKEHTYGDWEVINPATCSAKGSEHRFCTVCGHEDTREIEKDANNHKYFTSNKVNVDYNNVATTCDPNFETYWEEECEWCHNTIKHTVEHLDHNFNGERKYYTDKDCTQEVTGNLNCEKTYYYKTQCTNCDTWSDVETKPAGKHSYKVTDTKESTCKEKGYNIYTCDICGDEYIEYTDKKPHDFTGEVKYYEDEACTIEAPEQLDCETTYYYKTKCSNCDTWSDVEIREAGQHNWINDTSKEDIKSTCKTPGTHYKKCSICGKQDTDKLELDYNNHEGEEVSDNNAVAATCKTKGKTASTHCSACGNTVTPQTETSIDPNNHVHFGEEYKSAITTVYVLDDDLVEELGLEKNTFTSAEINIQDPKYYTIEHHWWATGRNYNKYYISNIDTYNETVDVSWYWETIIGKNLDPRDWHTYVIKQNPLIIAGAELNNMTPEEYTAILTDYCENPRTVYNVNTISGICQEKNSYDLVQGVYNPTGSGNGDVYIRRYFQYEDTTYSHKCLDCNKKIVTRVVRSDAIYKSGTAVGKEWEEEHYIKYE